MTEERLSFMIRNHDTIDVEKAFLADSFNEYANFKVAIILYIVERGVDMSIQIIYSHEYTLYIHCVHQTPHELFV